MLVIRVMCVLSHLAFRSVSERAFRLTYARDTVKPSIHARYDSRAYLSPLASNALLVPSRLAFLQRSASGTALRLS